MRKETLHRTNNSNRNKDQLLIESKELLTTKDRSIKFSIGSIQKPHTFTATGTDTMKRWLEMKYLDDLSDIRPEQYGYYKYYVHHFVDTFFSKEKINGKRILDFGCGPGFYSATLAERGAYITGIDKNKFLIEKAKELKARRGLENIDFVLGDFASSSIHLPYGSFDYILAIDVIVSFDYMQSKHAHKEVVRAFRSVRRLLQDQGRFYIIESHPFFGRTLGEVVSDQGDNLLIREAHYKFEYKPQDDLDHWFTLDELSRASNESGLAISRIYEPNPSPLMNHIDPNRYEYCLHYPRLIVYEMCKMIGV